MSSNKSSKEVVVFNCKELPEAIYVETRFISHELAKQIKMEDVFYITIKNGQMELSRQDNELTALKNYRSNAKNFPFALNIQSNQGTSHLQAVPQMHIGPLIQQHQPVKSSVPVATALTNLNTKDFKLPNNSNIVGSLHGGMSMPIPTVSIPISNTSHLKALDGNASAISVQPISGTSNFNMVGPKRLLTDRIQQTEVSMFNMKSIGIQCELSGDKSAEIIEWSEVLDGPVEHSLNIEAEKEVFLEFVKEHSVQYKNSYRECLVCGEICKTSKSFYGHMAIHRGPKVLCFKCGKYLDNEELFKIHKCRKSTKADKAFLHCPHYSCGLVAISRQELYDHINEHANNHIYKCTACRKAFYTCQEFLRHLLIRAKCYTSAKRKRFSIYGLEAHKDRLCRIRVFTLHTGKKSTTLVKTFLSQRVPKQGVCKICLRLFRNSFVFKRHRVKCVAKFRKRLMKKRGVSAKAHI